MKNILENPFDTLKLWLKTASQNSAVKEPAAMVLSTVGDLKPDSRVVLAKEVCDDGIIFYTNTLSVKGKQLSQNSQCHLLFYWDSLSRQVRMQGKVSLIDREKTIEYWETRSRQSQLSQWVSKQSQFLESRNLLESLVQKADQEFEGRKIPCPKNWSGYFVSIDQVEFWQEREHRLHDRFLFTQNKNGDWKSQRLYP